jgi:hypothetical protein
MNRRTILAAGLGAPLVLAGCGSPLIVDYRYRFKVVVRVDGEEHEGSSVFRVRFRDNRKNPLIGLSPGAGPESVTLWAEAPIVDLGPRHGLLFATLQKRVPGAASGYVAYVFPAVAVDFDRRGYSQNQPGTWEDDKRERVAALKEMADLTREYTIPEPQWPTFVRFADLQNPASVQEVTQANVAFFYGADAAIVRVTAQITDERPTRRIHEVLPWLRSQNTALNGDYGLREEGPIGGQLGLLDFVRWPLGW